MELLIARLTSLLPLLLSAPESREALKEALQTALRREGESEGEDVEISLALCDDAFIQQLNAQYRGLDKPTDVLSFAQEDGEDDLRRTHPGSERTHPGSPSLATPPETGGETTYPAKGLAGLASQGELTDLLEAGERSLTFTRAVSPPASGGVPEERGRGGFFTPRVLGDIVISLPTAERQAARAGWSVESEVTLLAIHGLLHLLGYDDETDAGAREMQVKTLDTLADCGVTLPEAGIHPFFAEYG